MTQAPTSPAKSRDDTAHPIVRPITTENPSAIPEWGDAALTPDSFDKWYKANVEGPIGTASSSPGCERPVTLNADQIRRHIDLPKPADAEELEQIDVLSALMCADPPGVRDFAARTALASPNLSVRAETLHGVMQQKQNMVVEFIEEEGISNEVRSCIQDKIALEY